MNSAAVKRLRQPIFLLITLTIGLHIAHSQQPQSDKSPDSSYTDNIRSKPDNSVGYFSKNTHKLVCTFPGTYLTGLWAGCYQNKDTFLVNTLGIAQRDSVVVDFAKVGDAMDQYIYMNGYGKSPQGDDEGIGAIHYQMSQYGTISGKVSSVATGENSTQTITFTGNATCTSAGYGTCSNPSSGYLFSQGALAYDASQQVAKFTPSSVSLALFSGGINEGNNKTGIGILLNTATSPFTVSTAWGTFEPRTCTGRLTGQFYIYQLTTCTVVLGTSPASPGNFVAGQSVTISAQFEETVTLTKVTPPVGGSQTISFYTVKNWHSGPENGVVMQAGNSGDMMVQNGFGWKIVGATSTSQAVISNCFLAWCQTDNPVGNMPSTASPVAIYHGAEVSGTSGGAFNKVQLTTNKNFTAAPGDIISQAISTSWFGNMMELDAYKATPETYGPNSLLQLADLGPAHYSYGLIIQNQGGVVTRTPAIGGLDFSGSYKTTIKSLLRPWAASRTSLGSIIEVGPGGNPFGSATDSYNLLMDDGGGYIQFTPGNYRGVAGGLVTANALNATQISTGTTYPLGAYISSPRFVFSPGTTGTQISSPSTGVISFDSEKTGDGLAGIKAQQMIAGGLAPTMTPGAAAGISPTCTTITGANMAGVITCKTGATPSASSILATITFHGTLGTAPQGCALMPRNAPTALILTDEYTTAPTTRAWTIAVGATALSASTTYSWSYQCE